MRIVFMGTADFGIPALECIGDSTHTLAGVITTPPRPQGRGRKLRQSPVQEYCAAQNIGPLFAPENLDTADFAHTLDALAADLYVVVAFRILPPRIFSIPRKGCFNIHASLLPKYRGPAPIQRAIESGEKTTGITIFKIDEGIDTGRIILQKPEHIDYSDTTPTLYTRLSQLGAHAGMEAIEMIEKNRVTLYKQDTSNTSSAPKLKKKEGRIDWTLPAEAIYNKIRAFKPFPGTHTTLDGKRIGVEWATPTSSDQEEFSPGTLEKVTTESITVKCGQDSLDILEVKPESKNRMSCKAYLRGSRLSIGQTFI